MVNKQTNIVVVVIITIVAILLFKNVEIFAIGYGGACDCNNECSSRYSCLNTQEGQDYGWCYDHDDKPSWYEIDCPCTDSDGWDYYTKGYTIGSSGTEWDTCIGTTLWERICNNGIQDTVEYSCPSGETCNEGICADEPPPNDDYCTDSDNGQNYNVMGTINNKIDGVTDSESDECINNDFLREYYCNGFNIVSVQYECPDFCLDGACQTSSCTSHDYTKCWEVSGNNALGDVYWYDSCGAREEVFEECSSTQQCHDNPGGEDSQCQDLMVNEGDLIRTC